MLNRLIEQSIYIYKYDVRIWNFIIANQNKQCKWQVDLSVVQMVIQNTIM